MLYFSCRDVDEEMNTCSFVSSHITAEFWGLQQQGAEILLKESIPKSFNPTAHIMNQGEL